MDDFEIVNILQGLIDQDSSILTYCQTLADSNADLYDQLNKSNLRITDLELLIRVLFVLLFFLTCIVFNLKRTIKRLLKKPVNKAVKQLPKPSKKAENHNDIVFP